MDEPKEPVPEVITTKTTTVAEGVQNTTPRFDSTPRVLAYLVTMGFFLVIAALIFLKIPTENREVLIQIIGTFGGGWIAIIAYFYGTSAGSEQRNAIRANKP